MTNNIEDISNLQDKVLTEISSLCEDMVEQIEVNKIKEQLQTITNFQQEDQRQLKELMEQLQTEFTDENNHICQQLQMHIIN